MQPIHNLKLKTKLYFFKKQMLWAGFAGSDRWTGRYQAYPPPQWSNLRKPISLKTFWRDATIVISFNLCQVNYLNNINYKYYMQILLPGMIIWDISRSLALSELSSTEPRKEKLNHTINSHICYEGANRIWFQNNHLS